MNRVDIEFTCDAAKAKRNWRIHKISFDTVAEAFAGPFVLIVEDCEDEFGEVRYDAIVALDRNLCWLWFLRTGPAVSSR